MPFNLFSGSNIKMRHRCADKSRIQYTTLSTYEDEDNNYDNDNYEDRQPFGYFSPNAPSDELAPIKPRATPYTEYPLRCSVDYSAGTIRCINNESRGGLYNNNNNNNNNRAQVPPVVVYPLREVQASSRPSGGNVLFSSSFPPSQENFNYVVGRNVIPERSDSPLNRILTRQALGPWEMVGAAITDVPGDTASKDRTMLVYAQSVDSARNRYNYRIVDNNSVPLDIGEKIPWKDDHAPLHVPGYPNKYRLKLYGTFRG